MSTRILVIEDNETNLELITYLLRASGYTLSTARDGNEGLDAAGRERPDFIICDVHMPQMDGYQVVSRLKADPALRHIPVVAVTALAMVGDRQRVLAAGFDGYLAKPITPERFVAQVESLLRPEQRARRLTEAEAEQRDAPTDLSQPHKPPHARLLAVDDSPVNLSLMRSTFEPLGFDVTATRSVEEALTLAAQNPPDVIVSDMHMPGASGYDFLTAAKSHPLLRDIPFVIVSSTAVSGHERRACVAAGVDRFIQRPIEPQNLLAAIEECIAARSHAHGHDSGRGRSRSEP